MGVPQDKGLYMEAMEEATDEDATSSGSGCIKTLGICRSQQPQRRVVHDKYKYGQAGLVRGASDQMGRS